MDDPSTAAVTEGFGLMFYNARWYDPALGRFAQADSIVPGGVQGLDRYAYVNNSPVVYVDPSGHSYCDSEYAFQEDCADTGTSAVTTGPTPVGNFSTKAGADFYKWYLWLYNQPNGWWWEVFGQDSDGFTIFDAVAVIMVSEAMKNWEDPNLTEALIRAASEFGCGGACTTEGFIDWFMRYSKSARGYVGRMTVIDDPRFGYWENFDSNAEIAMNNLARSIPNHNKSWDNGCEYESTIGFPCGWANNNKDGVPDEDAGGELSMHPELLFTYSDGWFIPSGCVVHYWLDPNFRNIDKFHGCPAVR
jgi:RHS repeat-associated protein